MKPEELEVALIDHERTMRMRHDVLFKLIDLWKATADYARLNLLVNTTIADAKLQHAWWDAKVAMANALKALEDR
jgi:hypothetical protein